MNDEKGGMRERERVAVKKKGNFKKLKLLLI